MGNHIEDESAGLLSRVPASRPHLPDPLHDQQLLRDVEIINVRVAAELGPLQADGLPVQDKRKLQPRPASAPIELASHTAPNIDSEDETMKWRDMASAAALGTASMLVACTTPSTPKTTAPTRVGEHQPTTSTDATNEFYRLHTLAEYPELTPEEMGRRVLKLINSLNTKDDWRIERIREVTGIPIAPLHGRDQEFAFVIHEPVSGWDYGLGYNANPRRNSRIIDYGFSKENEVSRDADIGAMCGTDARAFDAALRGMGFAAHPQYNDIGRQLGINYESSDKLAFVSMGLRPRSRTDGTACVDWLFIEGPAKSSPP